MTFNIRFDTTQDAPQGNQWSDRVASTIETVAAVSPDIVGFQEALRTQLDDLTSAFPNYRGIGKPRDVGDTAEYVPLFIRTDRFELTDHGDFWLSPTPEVEGSRGWDTDLPRHCTWATLSDLESGAKVAVYNTHLDSLGAVARFEAAKLIVGRATVSPGLPSIVMGDFNADEDSDSLDTFRRAGFRDTYRVIHPEESNVQTIHHYTELSGPRKIDYILCDRSWQVLSADIVREAAAGRLPSDHFPVLAELNPVL